MQKVRTFSLLDHFFIQTNHALSTLFSTPHDSAYPAQAISEKNLNKDEKRVSISCMRVNHTGEVCAQALYRGQAMTCKEEKTRELLLQSCEEETAHLAWTKKRLDELNGKTSVLNIFFYWNSFWMGVLVSLVNDRFSLGFVEETEIQVAKHLSSHLNKISDKDEKSRAIIEKMREDEMHHQQKASLMGADDLPEWVKIVMSLHAKVMTVSTYYI